MEASEESEESYERCYSDIGVLQKAHIMRYKLFKKENAEILEVERIQAGVERCERCALNGCDWRQGEMILRFLYENAAPIENWRDLVQDAIYLQCEEIDGVG